MDRTHVDVPTRPTPVDISRRHVLVGLAGALTAHALPLTVQLTSAAQDQATSPGWTHLVGGGGGLLFYNASTGAGLSGTLDGSGWHPVTTYADFATGFTVLVGTPSGSLLLLQPSSGLGAAGTLVNGQWSFLSQWPVVVPQPV